MPRDEFDDRDDFRDAKDKVAAPAIAMMVSAVLGILGSIALIVFAVAFPVFLTEIIDKDLQRQKAQNAQNAQAQAQLWQQNPGGFNPPPQPVNQGMDEDDVKLMMRIYGIAYGVMGFLSLIASAVMLYGAVKMKSLTSYGWAMTSSILGVVSGVFCCHILALAFGVWCLVVLVNPDVKRGFEAARRPARRREVDDPGYEQ